jgi:hypothetical protein
MESMTTALTILSQETVQTSSDTAKKVAGKDYAQVLKHGNITSYSQLEIFHKCPRKFLLVKEQAAFGVTAEIEREANIDFVFGHAVGSGVQNFMETQNAVEANLQAILAWKCDFFETKPKANKSIWEATLAVDKFIASDLLDDWELLYLPNGKPAIEVAFVLDCGNGFFHHCHADFILRHKYNKQVMVGDAKTSGFREIEEAIYANSSQALSYGLLLPAILPEEIHTYEVLYLVYSSVSREWRTLFFVKSMLEQAEYIKDLLLTQQAIKTYQDVGFFPKRGAA